MPDFAAIVANLKRRHAVRVRRWRSNMSGAAWRVYMPDGSTVNWIEAPFPKTPISLAIFLHEIGHHVIGFDRYRLRCEEELHAWTWAIRQMRLLGIEPDGRVMRRFELSMNYAVGKALRRGVKRLPESLHRYLPKAA
jgi:hypothetical protein